MKRSTFWRLALAGLFVFWSGLLWSLHKARAEDFYGTYDNPVMDMLEGDLSVPVHRGMYCVGGMWHYGWLRPWEGAIVIKPSCGTAVYQLPEE